LIGSTVETVVSSAVALGLSRSPICALAIPAMPLIGEVIRVKPRLSLAVSSARGLIEGCRAPTAPAGGVVQVLLADRVLLGQRLDARQVGRGRLVDGLPCCARHPCLIDGRLEGARVDLEQRLPLLDEVAFAVVLLDQVTRDLRPDRRVDVAVERTDPFL
jgi:hypothetical protein